MAHSRIAYLARRASLPPIAALPALLALLAGPTDPALAQAPGCPLTTEAVVAQALGTPVHGEATAGVPEGMDLCDFLDGAGTDYGVARQQNAFGPGAAAGPAALAQKYLPTLPEAALQQIDALRQAGMSVTLPGYQVTVVGGVGDTALWVQRELLPGFFKDSLLVQQGSAAFAFDVDDAPGAQATLIALAQAVLANGAA